jgi:hypothetical protein
MSDLRTRLETLSRAWTQERVASRLRFAQERVQKTLADRVEAGIALRDLQLDETLPARGGRTLLWFRLGKSSLYTLRDLRLGSGDPVLLWRTSVDAPDSVRAVIARKSSDRLAVMIEHEPDESLSLPGWNIDREAPEVTFDRGAAAIAEVLAHAPRSEAAHRYEQLFAVNTPVKAPRDNRNNLHLISFFDAHLEEDQKRAVQKALADDLSIIVGPPGTGKTRTLAEVVRQCVARGERVLVTAASHTAVDNLAERLVAANVALVRIGHPARVAQEMEPYTLDAQLEAQDRVQLATEWIREAEALKHRLFQRQKRDAVDREERRAVMEQVRGLYRSAKDNMKIAQSVVLDRARVVAVTSAGADVYALEEQSFDRVILDEATQAPDPIALVGLRKASKVVLAGDPKQLPPTVLSDQALQLGLGVTLFERLLEHDPSLSTLLRVQHRMHEALMRFPSEMSYGGALVAAPEVAHAVLTDDKSVRPDALREGPFVLLDTAGRGWDERRTDGDPSTGNPLQAERTALEVRRLLSRGVVARDIGVITPYQAQVRLLRDALEELLEQGLEVSSVDGFQGREKLVIVVDLVRSNDEGSLGFLQDIRRMNVALTRAKRWLMVIGDGALLARHAYYKALLTHAEDTQAWLSAWSDEAEPFA